MQYVRTFVVMLFLLGLTFTAAGCGALASGAPDTVTASDRQSQITIPRGWKVKADLHDEAEIEVGNFLSQAYLIVLSESKQDFDDITYERHSQLTRTGLLENLKNAQMSGAPTQLTINGMPAVQYEVRGSVDGVKLVYLHTTIDGKASFHQVITWTTPSRYAKNKATMQSVITSFKELHS